AYRTTLAGCREPASTIQFVRLNNQSRFSDSVILEKFRQQTGQALDTKILEEDVQRIHALGFLELVRYEVVTENQQTGVVLHVTQDSRGASFIEWGLDVAGDGRDNSIDLRLAYLKTDLDKLGSELRVLTQLGDEPGLNVELYKPLNTRQRWILNPRLFATRQDRRLYDSDGDARQAQEIDQLGGSVILAREFGRHAALFGGAEYRDGEIDVKIGDPAIASTKFTDGQWFAGFQWDRVDDLYFPGDGLFMEARYSSSLDTLGADVEYEQASAVVGIARSFGQHALVGIGRYATTLDDDAPIHAEFPAGGFNRLSGFNDNELVGQHFGMALFSHRYEIGHSRLLPAYIGYTLEYGNTADERSDLFAEGIFNGSLFVGYRSPVGPLYVGFGFAEGGRNRYFFRIGSFFGRGDLDR
ncbi:MAG: BamA/TamA family outer membrane protein, partial [Pseudomonadales bacterium]